MAKTTENKPQVARVQEMHLDDFLNSKEAQSAGIESLSAFASAQRKKHAYRNTVEGFEKAYKAFMNAIPN